MKRALFVGLVVAVLSAALWLLSIDWMADSRSEADRPRAVERDMSSNREVAPSARPALRDLLSSESDDRNPTSLADVFDGGIDAATFREERPIMIAMNRRKQAYVAFRAGDCDATLTHALATIEHLPRDGQAHRMAALCSCTLGDQKNAQKHAEMLDRRRFEKVQKRCRERGISLIHPYDPPVPAGEDAGQ